MTDEPIATDSVSQKLQRAETLEKERKGKTPGFVDFFKDDSIPVTESDEQSTGAALEAVKLRQQHQKLAQRNQDMTMRKRLARWTTGIVVAQVIVANVFFGFYLWMNATSVEPAVMIAWLSSTVVEVIGILWVIARSLFPYRDKSMPNGRRDNGHATP